MNAIKFKITGGLLGLVSLFMASAANAATISVNPAVTNVSVGDVFTLTVSGDFSAEGTTFGGGVILGWDTTKVQLNDDLATTRAGIEADLIANNWILPNAGNLTVTANSISVDVLNFFGQAPIFDIFSLDLVAVPPPSSGPITITASNLSAATGGWDNAAVDFVGATINVSDVATVPVPAAAWLFASGLLGMVGVARRRAA
jgi:hypothetical protein